MSLVRSRGADTVGPPPLVDICVARLSQLTALLGDVGHVEARLLRRVLAHCTRPQLACVEDATLGGSARALTWHTWHFWHRFFSAVYNAPPPSELLPLPGEPPLDYQPPQGVAAPPADYRAMLAQREAAADMRRQAAVSRLRANYSREADARGQRSVAYTAKLPPPQRTRTPTPPTADLAAVSHTLAGKPASKMLRALGLAPAAARKSPSPAGSSRVVVRREMQVQLAPAPAPAAARPSAQPPRSSLGKRSVSPAPQHLQQHQQQQHQQQQQQQQQRQHKPANKRQHVPPRPPSLTPPPASSRLHPSSGAAGLLDRPVSLGAGGGTEGSSSSSSGAKAQGGAPTSTAARGPPAAAAAVAANPKRPTPPPPPQQQRQTPPPMLAKGLLDRPVSLAGAARTN